MRLTTLFLLATLVATSASTASYRSTNFTLVDPIMKWNHGMPSPHPYSGENLEPYADLTDAFLIRADLTNANLSRSDRRLQTYFEAALLC